MLMLFSSSTISRKLFVLRASGNAVEGSNKEDGELPAPGVCDHGVQARTPDLGTGDSTVASETRAASSPAVP
jgi:hypothetical protein